MLQSRNFGSINELIDFRNGYVIARELPAHNYNLNGLTVIVNAVTTTFAGADLSPADVVAQINANVAGATAARAYGHAGAGQGINHALVFVGDGDVISNAGTANTVLGIPTAAPTTVGANKITDGQVTDIRYDQAFTTIFYEDWVSSSSSGYNAVLTAGYVAGAAVRVDQLRNIGILMQFTTGATGITDEWLPQMQVEVSDAEAPGVSDWRSINAQSVAAGVVTNTKATYVANAGAMYTAASTAYRDVLAGFENNPGWKWMRIQIKESKTPTNHGTAIATITGSKR